MSFKITISDELKKDLTTLKRKDKTTYVAVSKKIFQIASCDRHSVEHFKNLRGNLSDFKRVHIGSFVLIFRIVDDIIIFEKFDYHDGIYTKKS